MISHDPKFHGRYSRGQEHLPRRPRNSSYSDGIATPRPSHHGRFSNGQETGGLTAESEHEGTFADGMTTTRD